MMLTVDEARKQMLDTISVLSPENRGILDCLGHVLAEDLHAGENIPPFDNSAMDGFAVIAEDVKGMALIGRMLVGDETAIPKRESLNTLFILGADDKFIDSYKRILSNNLVNNVKVIDGCDQFFVDTEYFVGEAVASFLNQTL